MNMKCAKRLNYDSMTIMTIFNSTFSLGFPRLTFTLLKKYLFDPFNINDVHTFHRGTYVVVRDVIGGVLPSDNIFLHRRQLGKILEISQGRISNVDHPASSFRKRYVRSLRFVDNNRRLK